MSKKVQKVINKLSKLDKDFKVSSKDLSESINRVSSNSFRNDLLKILQDKCKDIELVKDKLYISTVPSHRKQNECKQFAKKIKSIFRKLFLWLTDLENTNIVQTPPNLTTLIKSVWGQKEGGGLAIRKEYIPKNTIVKINGLPFKLKEDVEIYSKEELNKNNHYPARFISKEESTKNWFESRNF